MSTVNWADLKQTAEDSSKPVPEGKYRVEIAKSEAVSSKESGSPQIRMQMRILDEGDQQGRQFFHQKTLTTTSPYALTLWFNFLEAFGITADWLTSNDATIDQIAVALVGRIADADVIMRPYQNQQRNDVKSFSAASDAIQPMLPDAQAMALASINGGGSVEDEPVF